MPQITSCFRSPRPPRVQTPLATTIFFYVNLQLSVFLTANTLIGLFSNLSLSLAFKTQPNITSSSSSFFYHIYSYIYHSSHHNYSLKRFFRLISPAHISANAVPFSVFSVATPPPASRELLSPYSPPIDVLHQSPEERHFPHNMMPLPPSL